MSMEFPLKTQKPVRMWRVWFIRQQCFQEKSLATNMHFFYFFFLSQDILDQVAATNRYISEGTSLLSFMKRYTDTCCMYIVLHVLQLCVCVHCLGQELLWKAYDFFFLRHPRKLVFGMKTFHGKDTVNFTARIYRLYKHLKKMCAKNTIALCLLCRLWKQTTQLLNSLFYT